VIEWLRRTPGKPDSPPASRGVTRNPDWMPNDDEILVMVSHNLGMSPNSYLVTRSREEFLRDSKGLLKSRLLLVEVVSSMFDDRSSGKQNSISQEPQIPSGDLIKSGPEMSDEDAAKWAQRELNSSRAYPWLKRSGRRSYNVINLDTSDPNPFMEGIRKFGR
ncbi:MAG: hypothetical protein VXW76_08160, partial [Actinomycetota bacterium]|nr:hypothetical protein [Actinomycetota bacterium]